MRTFLKGALVGGLAAAVVFAATAALAGTGIGGVFNLGKVNKVNAQSTLKGSTSGKNLQVTNTGSGSGVGITVGAGKHPIVVNAGAGKATNLNADKLDGKDSSAFLKNTVTETKASALVTHGGGFDVVRVDCPAGYEAIGGGVDLGNVLTMSVTSSAPVIDGTRTIFATDGQHAAATGWQASARNNDATVDQNFVVAVVCSLP